MYIQNYLLFIIYFLLFIIYFFFVRNKVLYMKIIIVIIQNNIYKFYV